MAKNVNETRKRGVNLAGGFERRHSLPGQCLCDRARLLADVPELERRRVDLLDALSRRSGVRVTILSTAYDLAEETGLDPVLALEIVGCGVGVIDLPGPEPEESALSLAPEWVAPPDEPEAELALERRMRLTFRRMRTLLEQADDLACAVSDFLSQPDVDAVDYDSLA
jgi:hypothetical protein